MSLLRKLSMPEDFSINQKINLAKSWRFNHEEIKKFFEVNFLVPDFALVGLSSSDFEIYGDKKLHHFNAVSLKSFSKKNNLTKKNNLIEENNYYSTEEEGIIQSNKLVFHLYGLVYQAIYDLEVNDGLGNFVDSVTNAVLLLDINKLHLNILVDNQNGVKGLLQQNILSYKNKNLKVTLLNDSIEEQNGFSSLSESESFLIKSNYTLIKKDLSLNNHVLDIIKLNFPLTYEKPTSGRELVFYERFKTQITLAKVIDAYNKLEKN